MALRIRVLSFLVIIINAMQSLGQAPNATAKEIGKFYLILNGVSLATKNNAFYSVEWIFYFYSY